MWERISYGRVAGILGRAGAALHSATDPEGRRIYAVTQGGYTPTGAQFYYSQKAALEAWKQYRADCA